MKLIKPKKICFFESEKNCFPRAFSTAEPMKLWSGKSQSHFSLAFVSYLGELMNCSKGLKGIRTKSRRCRLYKLITEKRKQISC